MKTSELTGALLDYWVAKAEGWDGSRAAFCAPADYAPSINWAQGGPLIDKYEIDLTYSEHQPGKRIAWNGPTHAFGDTPLQAVCRAVVRAKFGAEVPDQENDQ